MATTSAKPATSPQLAELFARYVGQAFHASPPMVESEVEAYQAPASAWLEPSEVWPDALAAAKWLLHDNARTDFQPGRMRMLPAWGSLVRDYPPTATILYCLGNAPQLLRDMAPLAAAMGRSVSRPGLTTPHALVGTLRRTFGPEQTAEAVLAASTLRLAHHYEEADQVLSSAAKTAAPALGPLLANEQAALAWHRGDTRTALHIWESSSAVDNPVVLFNRGVAALASGDGRSAAPLLERAAAAHSEMSPWHHLARLYQTLCAAA